MAIALSFAWRGLSRITFQICLIPLTTVSAAVWNYFHLTEKKSKAQERGQEAVTKPGLNSRPYRPPHHSALSNSPNYAGMWHSSLCGPQERSSCFQEGSQVALPASGNARPQQLSFPPSFPPSLLLPPFSLPLSFFFYPPPISI